MKWCEHLSISNTVITSRICVICVCVLRQFKLYLHDFEVYIKVCRLWSPCCVLAFWDLLIFSLCNFILVATFRYMVQNDAFPWLCWKAPILWHSAFFMVQLSHPYMTTGKTIALSRWTFVSKVTSLLFNMLSRLVITFLLRSKRLLISWLQSLSAVIFGA